MDYEVIEENKFKFIEKGEGNILMLLHGLFGALSNFEEVLERFSKTHKVVIPLLPIYNLPVLKATVNGLVKHVHKFVEHRGYDQFTLLGNSLGGHVSLVYSLKYPEKVRSMVLTGSSGLYENTLGSSFMKRGDYDFIKEKAEYTFYDPKNATRELVDEVFEAVNSREKALRLIYMSRSAMKHNLSKTLHKISQPVCLIWGKNDHITPAFVAEEFQKLIPDAELHFIEKCGHAPMMERPHVFNNLLDHFLNKHKER